MTTQDSTFESPEVHHETDAEGDHEHGYEHEGRHAGDSTDLPEVAEGGPTLLPVDAEEGDRDDETFVAHDDHTFVPDDESAPPAVPDDAATQFDDDGTTSHPASDPAETGAVQGEGFAFSPASTTDPAATDADVASGPAVVATSVPATTDTTTGTTTGTAVDDWHELQSHFVDDPADAVRQAGELVEHALADLRSQLESGDTENLRTAFRHYRDLHASLLSASSTA